MNYYLLFKLESPVIKKFPLVSENQWVAGDFILYNYKFPFTNSYGPDEAKSAASSSELCQQGMAINCEDLFVMFKDLTFNITSVFGATFSYFPGSTNSSICPCSLTNSCFNKTNCNCNGNVANVTDEGALNISAYDITRGLSPIIPFRSNKFVNPKSVNYTVKVKTFKCFEYIRLGILFSFNKFENKIFPIDNQFNATYDNQAIAIKDNQRKGVRFYSTIGANIWSTVHSKSRCFNNISECPLGISMSFWFRPSPTTSYTLLVMMNNTDSAYYIVYESNRIKVEVIKRKEIWRASSFIIEINQWINVIFSWHQFRGISLFINNIKATENGGTTSYQEEGTSNSGRQIACSEAGCLNICFDQNGAYVAFDDFYISENYFYQEIDRQILFSKELSGLYESLDNLMQLTDDIGWVWNVTNIEQSNAVINQGIKLGTLALTMINGCPRSLLECKNGFGITFWYKLPVNLVNSEFFNIGKVVNISYDATRKIVIESMYLRERVEMFTSVGVWVHLSLSLTKDTFNLTYNAKQLSNFNATLTNQNLANDAITWKFTGDDILIDEIFFDIQPITKDYLNTAGSKINKNYKFSFDSDGYEEPFIGGYVKKLGVTGKSVLSDKTIYSNYSFSKECFANFDWCQNGYTLSFWLRILAHSDHPILQLFNLKTSLVINYDPQSKNLTGTFLFINSKTTFQTNLKRHFWNFIVVKKSFHRNIEVFVNAEKMNLMYTNETQNEDLYFSSSIELGDNGPSTLQFDEIQFQDADVSENTISKNYGRFITVL